MKEMLEKIRRILGEKYLFIILVMNNFVNTLEDQGQLKEATTMKKKMLKKIRHIFDKKYLDIILVINNFVKTFKNQD